MVTARWRCVRASKDPTVAALATARQGAVTTSASTCSMTSDTAEAVVDAAALWTSVARGRAGTSTAAIGTTAVDVSSDVDLASDACLACVDTPPVVVVVVVDINLL
jgi:hypothetical protein